MHTTNPDLVALKTAARQQASRVEVEAKAASQWAALSRNRGFDEVAAGFEALSAALDDAASHAEAAASACFEAQQADDD
ncbi:MAG: hypothetical protein KKF41_04100 [Actinobacteria bacterium]|nr:hypothetical protein [Actinomycetota bacterium]MBU1943392.1 hypothetical protein [Actinomycetota bacterium]MBU2686749.1 hypothetical protein [Actinomycetota bacterium]